MWRIRFNISNKRTASYIQLFKFNNTLTNFHNCLLHNKNNFAFLILKQQINSKSLEAKRFRLDKTKGNLRLYKKLDKRFDIDKSPVENCFG